jgi:hypothetical protein
MKTKEQIIKSKPVFLHNWSSKFDVISDFFNLYISEAEYKADAAPYANEQSWLNRKAEMKKLLTTTFKGVKILFASYGTDNYSGDAWVLFTKDGELFETGGSHCSCYGLEDQWSPSGVVLVELQNRVTKGSFGTDDYSGNEFATELRKFLGIK